MEEQKNNQAEVSTEKRLSGETIAFGILSYISLLCIVPILFKRDDEFVMFHARQGLLLVVVHFGLLIVGIIPILGWIVSGLGTILLMIVALIGIVQVIMGNKWEIPVIKDWTPKLKI